MINVITFLPVIILSVDGSHPNQKTWVSRMDKNNRIPLYAVIKTHFRFKNMHTLKMKGWEKMSCKK